MRNCKECGKEYDNKAKWALQSHCSKACKVEVILRKFRKKAKRLPYNHKEYLIKRACSNYRSEAKRCSHFFDLTANDLEEHFMSDCTYCGGKIDGIAICCKDILKGYTAENVTPCCEACSKMKNLVAHLLFVEQCMKVANKHRNRY